MCNSSSLRVELSRDKSWLQAGFVQWDEETQLVADLTASVKISAVGTGESSFPEVSMSVPRQELKKKKKRSRCQET